MKALRSSTIFLFRVVTIPFLILFYIGVVWRRFAFKKGIFKSIALPGFTLAVGNIEAGGTGKTPIVIAIARYLHKHGARPAIVTRGYRSGLGRHDSMVLLGEQTILPPEHPGDYHADEAWMQARLLEEVPVIVGRLRHKAVTRYLQHFPPPTHFILDDGFQHLSIKRATDIVLLNAARPFANGFVFPWGRLREPPRSLADATVVLLTRPSNHDFMQDIPASLRRLAPPVACVPFYDDSPVQVRGDATDYRGLQRIAVVTAIAKPQAILDYPKQHGQRLAAQEVKSDHSCFKGEQIAAVSRLADAIITTEKDYHRDPKIFAAATVPVFVLPLRVDVPFDFLSPWLGLKS